jgi:hypothetical protein
VIVLLVWGAAVLVALLVLGIVGYDLWGRMRRLSAALSTVERDLMPRVQQVSAALATAAAGGAAGGTAAGATSTDASDQAAWTDPESTPGGPGRHRADP